MSKTITQETMPVIMTRAPTAEDDAFEIVVGITETEFEWFVETGNTHTFDFSEQGVPIKITFFGNKTRKGALAQIQPFIDLANNQVPIIQ